MKSTLTVFLLVFGAAWCVIGDSFLRLDGVTGPSRKDKYSGWIPINSFSSRGASLKTIGTTQPALILGKAVDSTSPGLAIKCADGTKSLSGQFESTVTNRFGSGFLLQVRLTNVVVLAVRQVGGASLASDGVMEQVELSPTAFQWTFTALTGIRSTASGAPRLEIRLGESAVDSLSQNFRSTCTLLPGGVLRLEWTPVPGGRFRLMGSSRLEGPFECVRTLDAGVGGTRPAIEIPTSGPFQFFRVELE